MTTLTLWLLVAIASSANVVSGIPSVALVERFLTMDECVRVRQTLEGAAVRPRRLACVKATVVR